MSCAAAMPTVAALTSNAWQAEQQSIARSKVHTALQQVIL
jgi:hypothetical protein